MMTAISYLTVLYFALLYMRSTVSGVDFKCRDRGGNPTDWFFMYKFPSMQTGPDFVQNGLGAAYLDPHVPQWALCNRPIDDTNQPIAYSMEGFYDDPENENILVLFFNDKPPGAGMRLFSTPIGGMVSSTAKGIILASDNDGFFIDHTVPGFPMPKYYFWPQDEEAYADLFFCMSLKLDQIFKLAEALVYSIPVLYHTVIPSDVADNEAIQRLLTPPTNWQAPYRKDTRFPYPTWDLHFFGQLNGRGKIVYDTFLSPKLDDSLKIYSNCRYTDSNCLNSKCSGKYKDMVSDADCTVFHIDGKYYKVPRESDRSNWAITYRLPKHNTCMVSTSRTEQGVWESSFSVCIDNPQIYDNFEAIQCSKGEYPC